MESGGAGTEGVGGGAGDEGALLDIGGRKSVSRRFGQEDLSHKERCIDAARGGENGCHSPLSAECGTNGRGCRTQTLLRDGMRKLASFESPTEGDQKRAEGELPKAEANLKLTVEGGRSLTLGGSEVS